MLLNPTNKKSKSYININRVMRPSMTNTQKEIKLTKHSKPITVKKSPKLQQNENKRRPTIIRKEIDKEKGKIIDIPHRVPENANKTKGSYSKLSRFLHFSNNNQKIRNYKRSISKIKSTSNLNLHSRQKSIGYNQENKENLIKVSRISRNNRIKESKYSFASCPESGRIQNKKHNFSKFLKLKDAKQTFFNNALKNSIIKSLNKINEISRKEDLSYHPNNLGNHNLGKMNRVIRNSEFQSSFASKGPYESYGSLRSRKALLKEINTKNENNIEINKARAYRNKMKIVKSSGKIISDTEKNVDIVSSNISPILRDKFRNFKNFEMYNTNAYQTTKYS